MSTLFVPPDKGNDSLQAVGAHGMRTSALLGDKKIIRDTMEYIEKTGRFKLEQ
jgi:hypothetical protein